MKNIVVLFCILWTYGLSGQNTSDNNNTLRGEIVFMNSDKQPAVGVEVAGTTEADETANVVYTNSKGAYELKFPVSRVGYPVDLKIGTADGKGKAIEVVNEKEVELCKIPAKVTDVFKVIVCRKGYRDQIAQKYYNIIKTSSDIALANKEKALNKLLNDRKKDYQKIADLTTELDLLQQQTDSVKTYKEAFQIASINKDDASKRVLRYIELLEDGKSIQVARGALSVKEAAIELKSSISQFNAAIEELETRANASTSIFEYQDAICCYDTIIHFSEQMNIAPIQLSEYYFKNGEALLKNGQYDDALKIHKKMVSIRAKILDPNHPELAVSYNAISQTYGALGQYKEALDYLQKAVAVQEDVLDSLDLDLAESYNNMGVSYWDLGDYEKAMEYNQKAVHIQEKVLGPKHVKLAISYGNICNIYIRTGQFDASSECFKNVIEIQEDQLPSHHPDLAHSYNSIAFIYQNLGQYSKALEYHQKAIDIHELILAPLHPYLAHSYNNLAMTYLAAGEQEKALEYHLKTLAIKEEVLAPDHIHRAATYANLGRVYQSLKKNDKALEYYNNALNIQEKVLGTNHPDIATTCNYLGGVYLSLKNYQKSLALNQRALSIRQEIFDNENPNPKLGIAHWYLAKSLKEMNSFSDAIAHQEKCISNLSATLPEDHPYHAQALLTLVEIYKKGAVFYANKKDKDKSLSLISKAIELGFNDVEWIKAKDSLKILANKKEFIELLKQVESQKIN